MRSFITSLLVLNLFASTTIGCAVENEEPTQRATSNYESPGGTASLGRDTYAVMQTSYGVTRRTDTLHYRYGGTCGAADYDLDVSVEFGRVTADSMEVRSVTFSYRPLKDGDTLTLGSLVLWTNDEHHRVPGYTLTEIGAGTRRYPVNRTFFVRRDSLLSVDFSTGSGAPDIANPSNPSGAASPGDVTGSVACGNPERLVFYPAGMF